MFSSRPPSSFRWLAIVLLVLAASPQLSAIKHPVPLEKGVSEASCLDCHAAQTQGKVIHAAVQMGCFTCHAVRGSGEETRVILKHTNSRRLCTECHDAMKAPASRVAIHQPATKDCVQCHEPHAGPNKALLKKTASGGKSENLCLSCHNQGLATPANGSRHAALDMGCDSCHVTHKSGEIGKPEFDFHLAKSVPALCADCHDPKDNKLSEAHNRQPFANANCTQCHDPHQSKSPKLMQAHEHQPFQDKTACSTCHEPAAAGKVKLTQADSKGLCLSCHDEQGKKIDAAKVQHPGAQGDCTACHDPHAGKYARFVKPSPVAACESCHESQAGAHKIKRILHEPAYRQGCSVCHEPHGGAHAHLLRTDDVDRLCLTCHGQSARAMRAQDGSREEIFEGSVRLPAGYVGKIRRITLESATAGHPVPAHPIVGKDPRDKSKRIDCVSCHDPHAGGFGLPMAGAETPRAMCKQCHKEQR